MFLITAEESWMIVPLRSFASISFLIWYTWIDAALKFLITDNDVLP